MTVDTLVRLQQTVEPLMSDQSSISAITIVCPADTFSALQTFLHGGSMDTFLDINIALWPEGLEEAQALMHAAAQVSTEYALIIDNEGFGDLHEESRDHLLSHPFLLDVPSGFCGANLTKARDYVVCAAPHVEPGSAFFLFPPFVIPSPLIRGFNPSTIDNGTFWSDFGRTVLHANGIGVVVRESEKTSDKDWCHVQCLKHHAIDEPTLAQCLTLPESSEASEEMNDLAHSSSLAVVLQTLKDLREFSNVVCRFMENGYNVHVLILSHDTDHVIPHDGAFPWFHEHLVSDVCGISFSALHSSSNIFANAEALNFWLKSANESMSIIFYGLTGLEDASQYSFKAELERQSASGVMVIRLPHSDLPYCDWIASLTLEELRSWHAPDIELSVITDNRPSSLERLLKSLEGARYFGDSVSIRINEEQTADMHTRRIVDQFSWIHGEIFVHHRVVHAGLRTAIVESWYPHSNHSYVILLEDDVEVSPLFYAWAKMSLLRYRYGASNRQPTLFGISLYQQKQIELRPEGRRPFDAQALFDSFGVLYRNTPYLSQIPCSWGAVYFPEHWQEFHAYLTIRLSKAWIPLRDHVVPDVRSNRWAKSWKKFFIELAYLRGYVMLYPNYDDFVSLSTNHLEVGSHVKEQPQSVYEQKKALFTLPLMTLPTYTDDQQDSRSTGLLELPDEQLPEWSDLPVLDLLGRITSGEEIVERGKERQKELAGCVTIGSQPEQRQLFRAEELFRCSGVDDDSDELEDEVDSSDSL
ncbi:uncharacterized protein FOMMEDRAFT_24784 [Fomitiporia mediterranea MF3/22]|uniref:uncharacterized protein n=1 Tax=Fomitiporia mediterranea (strain MF3/22) TaxID=694068 RepID=UPI00044092AC|nr:uncharacterized protein FOMMEDRAFT_24784 [Fomitiporia mediterranea MF3/22]EJD07400.1 hypothetical protein FOMMEDRAFT_24784 [Fomitiporia mediterranea MF3/22]